MRSDEPVGLAARMKLLATLSSRAQEVSVTGLLPTLLLVLFVGLKLAEKINWSWWWVLSPVWIPAGIVGVIFIFYLILSELS